MNNRTLINNRFHRTDNRVYDVGTCCEPVPDVKDKDSQLLDYIYSIDPTTGVPRGDIAQFLGENTNEQVKSFIQMNLMKDNVQEQVNVSVPNDVLNKMRDVINDDDIAYFSRNDGESSEEYAQRMHNYFAEERYKNALRKQNKDMQSFIKKALNDDK